MTATLVAKDLAAGHGDRTLFAELDLVVAPGDVIGLVGANGAGKSTLLRMLAGLDRPEEGELKLSPPTATVGHLPQEPERRPGETVREFLARRTGVAAAQEAMDEATQALVDGAPGADDAYATSLERWLALGGADLDERAEEVAGTLGLTVGLDLPMTALSGGQAARAGLASLLLSRYDVFLLDEPTNDLDLDGLERLERVRPRTARRHGRRQPRPRVPHPHGHQGPRTRPRPAADHPVRRRLRGLSGGAGDGPPARPRGLRGVRRQAVRPRRPRADAALLDGQGRQERPPQGEPTTTRSAASSAARRARSRRPRPGRRSA